ncbi:MAG TPA: hypothetical protein VI382_07035, partial [Candidatus Manganitrophaceae bacterium]|nr:hypothetical protein [Candidatus Manganitrophaceae bacterium]
MKKGRFFREGVHRLILALGLGLPLFLLAPDAWPAALTWVGTGADNDFNTAGNWSPAQQPTSADTCTINGTSSRQPSILTNANCGSLTLGGGGTVMTLTFAA